MNEAGIFLVPLLMPGIMRPNPCSSMSAYQLKVQYLFQNWGKGCSSFSESNGSILNSWMGVLNN